jgi:hypothetical protein
MYSSSSEFDKSKGSGSCSGPYIHGTIAASAYGIKTLASNIQKYNAILLFFMILTVLMVQLVLFCGCEVWHSNPTT